MLFLTKVTGNVLILSFLLSMVSSFSVAASETEKHVADVTWDAISNNRGFVGVLHAEGHPIQLGTFLQWKLQIKDRDGKPMENVRIGVSGGMKGHRHGLPSQPIVKKHSAEGWYLVDGLKFSMAGKWQLNFVIQQGSVRDVLEIPIELNY